MADGSFPTLVSLNRDANALANPIWVKISDGTTGVTVDLSGNLNVNIAASSGLADVNDNSAFTFNSSKVAVTGFVVDEVATNSVTENDVGAPRMTAKRIVLNTICDPTTDSQRLGIDASGRITVNVNGTVTTDDLNLTDDAVRVSGNSTANSATNPIYVTEVNPTVVTGQICDYSTATPGADATSNHDYTVVNTMNVTSIIVSASGGLKAELQVGPVGTLVSKAVLFIPRQGGSQQVEFEPPIRVPNTSTGTVRIIRTNRQGASMDVYSTIVGQDA